MPKQEAAVCATCGCYVGSMSCDNRHARQEREQNAQPRRIEPPETRHTRFTNCRVHDECDCDPWTYCYIGPWWPGSDSDEWIEYVPAPPVSLLDIARAQASRHDH